MGTLEDQLAWTGVPVPVSLKSLGDEQSKAIADYTKEVIAANTDGFDELYHAIGMIVKYIPHFIVIPLMVEHIRPRIAAGVCTKMGVDQAVHYANDLPLEYFSEVSKHLPDAMMSEILEKMKRHHAEKVIHYELQHHLTHMLDIAEHFDEKQLKVIARMATLPERDDDLLTHPHRGLIEKIRALQ